MKVFSTLLFTHKKKEVKSTIFVFQFHCSNMLYRCPVQKPQKPPSDEEDDDSNSLSAVHAPSRDRPGRAKKEVKYFDESDDEEEDDDDDMFD